MKKLLGIVFLVAAATVVYFGSVGWPSLDVNLWSLIPVGLFLFFTLENLLKKDYKASLMCLIIAFIIANAILDLLPISSGLVIGAGVLACVGIGYLFPDKEGESYSSKISSNHVNVALDYICDYLQPQNSVLSSLRLVF
ncbi:Uncharacterised protein [Streptococcus pneumoniae]|nr:Uncharacterised protein [Streptococcus pneumoniae]